MSKELVEDDLEEIKRDCRLRDLFIKSSGRRVLVIYRKVETLLVFIAEPFWLSHRRDGHTGGGSGIGERNWDRQDMYLSTTFLQV
jgi:hypothetical protein